MDIAVVGSQIVGLVPLDAVMTSAEYYIRKESLFILEDKHRIRLVSSKKYVLTVNLCFVLVCKYNGTTTNMFIYNHFAN